MLGFLIATIYVPDWTGYAIPTGWLLLSIVLPWLLRGQLLSVNAFYIYAAMAMAWTLVPVQGVYDLWKLAMLSGVFLLGHSRIDVRRLYVGMAYGIGVSVVVAVAQSFGWTGIPSRPVDEAGWPSAAGLFFSANHFGEAAAMISVVLIASGLYWHSLLTLPGVILSESRTALLVIGLLGVTWLWSRSRGMALAILLGAGIAGALVHKSPTTLSYRAEIWKSAIDGMTWFGRGPGSYMITSPLFSAFHTEGIPNREEDAHNDFLQMAYQYGVGAALLLPLVLCGVLGPLSPERYLFLAFCIIACLNFPLEIPVEAFLGLFAMGRLWRDRSLVWHRRLVRGRFVGGWLAVPQYRHGRSRRKAVSVE